MGRLPDWSHAAAAGPGTAQRVGCARTSFYPLLLSNDLEDGTPWNMINSTSPPGLQEFDCHVWELGASTYLSSDYDCVGPDRWLLLEFWRMRPPATAGGPWVVDSLRWVSDLFFLAGKFAPVTLCVQWL